MVQVRVEFDKPVPEYIPGEVVTGRVYLVLTHTVGVCGVETTFNGISNVMWKKEVERDDETVIVAYESEEQYFTSQFYIFGGVASQSTLHAGEYNFLFKMQLPNDIPSSFEGKYGFVRYFMSVNLTAMKQNFVKQTVNFRVFNPIDLNRQVNVMRPVTLAGEKRLCCCCCASIPITYSMTLPMAGFAFGQKIPLSIDIENGTRTKIDNIIIKVQRTDTFYATRPEEESKSNKLDVVTMQLGRMPRNSSLSCVVHLSVPKEPSSGFPFCNIIDTSYLLMMEGQLPAPHLNFRLETPLILGDIPVASSQDMLPATYMKVKPTVPDPDVRTPLLANAASP